MLRIEATPAWHAAHPGACIGVLELSGIVNAVPAPALETLKRRVEEELRETYGQRERSQLAELPVLRDYIRYYKRFDKTYHVLLQLESVARKGKRFPCVSPLVDANFVAELRTLVLTAGHDAARLHSPLKVDVSQAGDTIRQMNGSTKTLPAGDMVMRDAESICCSILYGQDDRSPISSATTHALYVAYAPSGVTEEAVRRQLDAIANTVAAFCSACVVKQLTLLRGD